MSCVSATGIAARPGGGELAGSALRSCGDGLDLMPAGDDSALPSGSGDGPDLPYGAGD